MTSRIQYRTHFNRVLGYALKRSKRPEVLASTLGTHDTQGMISEMEQLGSRSSRCQKPVAHYVLSIEQGKRLSDGQWCQAANRVAETYGMQQFVAIRHSDTDCDHLHIVANRVRSDGKTWSTSNDRFKMRSLCQEMEKDFSLTATPTRSRRSRINKDELEKADRLCRQGKQSNAVPARLQLAEEVRASLALAKSREDFQKRLSEQGISVQWRHDKQGRPIGFSFGREQVSISGRNAGISCRAVLIHFNEGHHESHPYHTRTSGDSRMDRTIGRGFGLEAESGFEPSGPGHRGTGLPDSSAGGDPAHHRRSDSAAADFLVETTRASGMLFQIALDRLIREAGKVIDTPDTPDRSHPHTPAVHTHLRRILRPARKQPRRHSR